MNGFTDADHPTARQPQKPLTVVNVLKKANVPFPLRPLLTQRTRVAPALLAGAPKKQGQC